LPVANASPWPRVPDSAHPRVRGDAAVAWSPPTTLRRCCRPPTTSAPHAAHAAAASMSLSPRSYHTGAKFPFASSLLPSSQRQPPSRRRPGRAAVPSAPKQLRHGCLLHLPPAAKGLHDASPPRSSSDLIYAVLSTA
jgi:hypothetical protein